MSNDGSLLWFGHEQSNICEFHGTLDGDDMVVLPHIRIDSLMVYDVRKVR